MKTTRGSKPFRLDPPQLYVASSLGKGRGVFAGRAFRKGEKVEIAPVVLIPELDNDLVQFSHLGNYLFQVAESDRCAVGLGFSSLYNHAGKKSNCVYSLNADVVIFEAVKNIKKDEELTVDYGWEPK